MAERLFTIPITCYYDRRAHEVTDENIAAGRRTGHYEALCGYLVVASAMAAPVGQPCPRCITVLIASLTPTSPPWRGRHRRLGWLWRILHPARLSESVTPTQGHALDTDGAHNPVMRCPHQGLWCRP